LNEGDTARNAGITGKTQPVPPASEAPPGPLPADLELLGPAGAGRGADSALRPLSLAPKSMLLLGQMLLSKFQLELMRRESLRQEDRRHFYLYADEFQTFAGVAEGTWRELMSRGRRMGLSFTLAHQHPSQLPAGLVDEILGNVGPFIVFSVSAKDAQIMRKELLELSVLPGEGGRYRSRAWLRSGQGRQLRGWRRGRMRCAWRLASQSQNRRHRRVRRSELSPGNAMAQHRILWQTRRLPGGEMTCRHPTRFSNESPADSEYGSGARESDRGEKRSRDDPKMAL
jgi:hypothetical protein